MGNLDEVCDIFATLHDGQIEDCVGTSSELSIKVDCAYLAQYVEDGFNYFYIVLTGVEKFCFEDFDYPVGSPNRLLYEYDDIAKSTPTLLYAKVESDCVIVDCTNGILYVRCESLEVQDEQRRQLLPDQLFDISEKYWAEFARLVNMLYDK